MRPLTSICTTLLFVLAGCATMTPEERRARDEQECRSYGFRPKTDAFAACLQRIELDRRAQRRYQMMRLDEWDDRPLVLYRPVIVRGD